MLSLQEQRSKFFGLNEWFSSDQGKALSKAFRHELEPVKHLLYGKTLLQLGSCENHSLFFQFPFYHQLIASPVSSPQAHIISHLEHLPFNRECIDCIIAPLTLDAFSNFSALVDEIDRILLPFGYAVFFGINPLSLWGLWLHWAKNTCFGNNNGFPRSVFSLKIAMLHRGYRQCHLSSFYYIPPLKTKESLKKWELLNQIGKMVAPLPAGFYCLVVQKEQETFLPYLAMTPKETFGPALIQPT